MPTTPAPVTAPKPKPEPAPLPQPSSVVLTVKQLAEQQPGLTEGGIRWDLHDRQNNGLAASGAVLRRGRKILIDPDRYLAWLRTNREQAA